MELYLDSAETGEIRQAFERLPFMAGLTTTPTFMARHGITDIDGTILELSKIAPILQIEALGKTAEDIIAEAKRQEALGLERSKTVYKIPVSLEGLRACHMLVQEGFLVNVHLVYTLQQAYMAMAAGASYVCPLVGRFQDQGHDALALVEKCVDTVNYYGYSTKIMFSSVRNAQHVQDAARCGVQAITAPWKIIAKLTDNHLTSLGTEQFEQDTHLMRLRVSEVLSGNNPTATSDMSITDCLLEMTRCGSGAITIINEQREALGIFTDGDLRRILQNNANITDMRISEHPMKAPITIEHDALLFQATQKIAQHKVDELVVTDNGKVIGLLDVQDTLLLGVDS